MNLLAVALVYLYYTRARTSTSAQTLDTFRDLISADPKWLELFKRGKSMGPLFVPKIKRAPLFSEWISELRRDRRPLVLMYT